MTHQWVDAHPPWGLQLRTEGHIPLHCPADAELSTLMASLCLILWARVASLVGSWCIALLIRKNSEAQHVEVQIKECLQG